MIKQSFPARLSLNVIMLTSILFIATIATASYSSHKILAEEAQTSSEHLLASAIKDIEKSLGNVESSIQSVAWLVDENNTDKEYLYHIVEKIVAENENIIGSTVSASRVSSSLSPRQSASSRALWVCSSCLRPTGFPESSVKGGSGNAQCKIAILQSR